ncbi:MAG: hypothetical protein H6810_11795 [Phycisphaeraceae bacterium]|nr:MAG: hypothetical protein H6810_11795 [Phycisphaeraceae bacterium]
MTTNAEPSPDTTPPANGHALEAAARINAAVAAPRKSFFERIEAFISRLSTRNNFWHRVTSLIWLPYAFRSGIRMRRVGETTFAATLPFNRFNKNWYNAMAGAALLGNSEIAGGMYVFGVCGGDYTVVCKNLEYRFLRPCFGPAEYRITPREDVHALVVAGGEFNITIELDIVQIIPTMVGDKVRREIKKERRKRRRSAAKAATAAKPSREERLERLKNREKRVGRATATFHVTPKAHHKAKAERANPIEKDAG